MLMRFANILMLAFFVWATAVQVDDPDPYLWMPIYAVASLWCAWHLSAGSAPRLALGIYGAGCAAGALYLGLAEVDWRLGLAQEECREMFGLVIVVVWSLVLLAVRAGVRDGGQQASTFLPRGAKREPPKTLGAFTLRRSAVRRQASESMV